MQTFLQSLNRISHKTGLNDFMIGSTVSLIQLRKDCAI